MNASVEIVQDRSRSELRSTVRRWATIGGIGILMIAALSVFANFLVLERLVTPGDAAATARDIVASRGLFQAGIVGWIMTAALDILVAGALFFVLRPISRRLAAAAAWSRVLYGVVLVAAIFQLIAALGALGGQVTPGASRQALQKIEGFTDVWNVGLILFGIHLLLVGYLAYRSAYMPKFVGVVVGLAGFGYLFDAAARAIIDEPAFSLSVITGLGEFVLGMWLVIRGRRISLPAATQVGGSAEREPIARDEAKALAYVQPTYRKTAALVGFLFLSATATFMAGNAMIVSYFSGDSPRQATLITGVLLEVYCALAGAGIGVAMLPVLRPYNSGLAHAYAALRVGEGLVIIAAGIYMVSAKQQLGNYDAFIYLFTTAGGLIFSYLLYVSRLIPRWLAQLGLVGYAVLAFGIPIALMGVVELDRGWGLPFVAIGGIFELVVPLLLVVKGFSSNRISPRTLKPASTAA